MKKGLSIPHKPVVKIEIKKTYLALIRNSIGVKFFQECYALVDGELQEILDKGDKSCAFYATSILTLCGFLPNIELTVHRMHTAMEENGWYEVHALHPGNVIFWHEKVYAPNTPRKHVGFYIGNNLAISNDGDIGVPLEHNYAEYKGRGIQSVWSHALLHKS